MDRITLVLSPTNQCNLHCPYCYKGDDRSFFGKMTVQQYRTILDKVEKAGALQIRTIWHGGEPLLMGEGFFKEVFRANKDKARCDIKVAIQTNGTLLNKEFIDALSEEGVRIGFSYDGLETNKHTRGCDEIVLGNMRYAKTISGHAGAICVYLGQQVGEIVDTCDLFQKEGFGLSISPVFKEGYENMAASMESFGSFYSEFAPIWKSKYRASVRVDPFCEYQSMAEGKRDGISCYHNSCLKKFIRIDHNGDVYPCGRSWPEEYRLGNIFESELEDIFSGEAFLSLVSKAIVRRAICKESCPIFSQCRGGCNFIAYLCGDVSSPPEPYCKMLQSSIELVSDTA